MQNLIDIASNSFIFLLALAIIRYWLKKLEEKISDSVSDATCKERQEVICKKITKAEVENEDQWHVINRHGHKGLSGENNQVVRIA